MDKEMMLKKYADVVAEAGLNVQKGDIVQIQIDSEAVAFARHLNRACYALGAKRVMVDIGDAEMNRDHLMNADESMLSTVPDYVKAKNDYLMNERVSMLFVKSTSPEALKDVDSDRLSTYMNAVRKASQELSASRMRYEQNWCICGFPSIAWAKLVFPELPEEEAYDKLFETIIQTVRVNQDDPVQAWNEHSAFLKKRGAWLSEYNFDKLVYRAPGTELEIGLIDGSQWAGGGHVNRDGNHILVNMPTEEVFNSPDYRRVNGYVSNTLPLSYNGNIIDNFKLTFKDGVVTEFEAETGYDVLKSLLETDEGAKRLGEVALVPVDSPISNAGILFYNTLFDENASCHVALGKAYPGPVPGASEMNEAEMDAAGLNQSLAHVDFMIGSSELDIDGVTRDGQIVPVFRNGNWVE